MLRIEDNNIKISHLRVGHQLVWLLIFFAIVMTSACGKTSTQKYFARPEPGETGLLKPVQGFSSSVNTNGTALFLRFSRPNLDAKPEFLHLGHPSSRLGDKPNGGFFLSEAQLTGRQTVCTSVGKNMDDFIREHPHLIQVCDPGLITGLPTATMLTLVYRNGISKILTGVTSQRTVIDNFDVIIVDIDN